MLQLPFLISRPLALFHFLFFTLLFVLSTLCFAQNENKILQGFNYSGDIPGIEKIDVQQQIMESNLDDGKWDDAMDAYTTKESGQSLQNFSTLFSETEFTEPFYQLFRRFYNNRTYADEFVTTAIDGKGQFSPDNIKDDGNIWRGECANKGSQYMNVWMYVIHLLEDAGVQCGNDTAKALDKLDQSWAVYTGSLERTQPGKGKLIYTLAEKRAEEFGTKGTSASRVNEAILELYKSAKTQLSGNCDAFLKTRTNIVKNMTVPLVQGILRYVVKAANSSDDINLPESQAKGWAFINAAFPLINLCSATVANTLDKNFAPDNKPMVDSVKKVASELQGIYGCLGMSCADVGANFEGDSNGGKDKSCKDSNKNNCIPECKDAKNAKYLKDGLKGLEKKASDNTVDMFKKLPKGLKGRILSGGATGGIVIGVLAVIVIVAAVAMFIIKKKNGAKPVPTTDEDV